MTMLVPEREVLKYIPTDWTSLHDVRKAATKSPWKVLRGDRLLAVVRRAVAAGHAEERGGTVGKNGEWSKDQYQVRRI